MQNDWTEADNALQKTFQFTDFKSALAFVNKVGQIAESLQHHPDISIKDYNKVFISTTSHDKGNTITTRDHALATAIDKV